MLRNLLQFSASKREKSKRCNRPTFPTSREPWIHHRIHMLSFLVPHSFYSSFFFTFPFSPLAYIRMWIYLSKLSRLQMKWQIKYRSCFTAKHHTYFKHRVILFCWIFLLNFHQSVNVYQSNIKFPTSGDELCFSLTWHKCTQRHILLRAGKNAQLFTLLMYYTFQVFNSGNWCLIVFLIILNISLTEITIFESEKPPRRCSISKLLILHVDCFGLNCSFLWMSTVSNYSEFTKALGKSNQCWWTAKVFCCAIMEPRISYFLFPISYFPIFLFSYFPIFLFPICDPWQDSNL